MTQILHLEDSALDHELVERALLRGGIDAVLTRVASLSHFFAVLPERKWDAILTDYHLPDGDGMAALRHVRQTDGALPFIFVSGVLGEETAIDTLKSGATDYVLKSRLQRLASAVKRALQESEDRQRRLAAEDALVETERRFEAMANSAPVPLWVIGPDNNYEFFNHQWLKFTGRTLEEQLASTWTDSIHPDDLFRWTEMFEASFTKREPFTTEVRLRRADGQYRVVALSLSPRFTPSGEFHGMIGSSIDVTEMRQAEERLLHVAKLESLGMMAGGIAHHFNNLMTGVLGYAGLVKDKLPQDSPEVILVEKILQAGNSAAQLTRQMLAYSGRGRLATEPVSITSVVRRAKPLMDTFVPRSVQLNLELQDEIMLIDADPDQIQQAVVNLVINAGEAVEHVNGGMIRVRTYSRNLSSAHSEVNITGDSLAPGPHVILEVLDNGVGMDLHTQSRIFDPFFTTKFTGRGLGLAAVLGVARSHKAGIQLRSERGHGSTFTLLFPKGSQAIAKPEENKSVKELAVAETALVVDDEPLVLHFVKLSLMRSGLQVITAENGLDALNKMNGARFDLVLLDAVMPEMDGAKTLKIIRSRYPKMPVIGMSGYDEVEAAKRFGSHMEAFIEKPFTRSQLMRTVANVLTASERKLPLATHD